MTRLIPSIRWLDGYGKWRDKQRRMKPDVGVFRFAERPEKYLRRVQVNALMYCVGRSDGEIQRAIERLTNETT